MKTLSLNTRKTNKCQLIYKQNIFNEYNICQIQSINHEDERTFRKPIQRHSESQSAGYGVCAQSARIVKRIVNVAFLEWCDTGVKSHRKDRSYAFINLVWNYSLGSGSKRGHMNKPEAIIEDKLGNNKYSQAFTLVLSLRWGGVTGLLILNFSQ